MNRFREGIFQPTIGPGFGVQSLLSIDADHDQKLRKSHSWTHVYLLLQELLSHTKITVIPSNESISVGFGKSKATLHRPSMVQLNDQLQWVVDLHDLREDRGAEILSQSGDVLPYLGQIIPIRPDRTPATLVLIDALVQFCMFVHFRLKHDFSVPRPADLSPQVQPLISTPGHSSYPMGHATEAYAVATLMDYLVTSASRSNPNAATVLSEVRTQLYAFAYRISFNRLVAGVHFPVDHMAGAHLGRFLGMEFLKAQFIQTASDQTLMAKFIEQTKGPACQKLGELPQTQSSLYAENLKFADQISPLPIADVIANSAVSELAMLFPKPLSAAISESKNKRIKR